ncbi:hypothetical protein DFH11DRAFT_1546350 [Phellopilus nigrolimitatus]|nr:hypothetical protein DFH11DRAFT_1546350 [Phellopilus nigrolimitatus]
MFLCILEVGIRPGGVPCEPADGGARERFGRPVAHAHVDSDRVRVRREALRRIWRARCARSRARAAREHVEPLGGSAKETCEWYGGASIFFLGRKVLGESTWRGADERKEARAHHDRTAAQNSRDKRKAQYTAMECRIAELKEENRLLRAGMHTSDSKQRTDDRRQEEELEREKVHERENTELKERIKSLEKGWEAVMKVFAIKGFRHLPHLLLLAIHRTRRRLPLIRQPLSLFSSPTFQFPSESTVVTSFSGHLVVRRDRDVDDPQWHERVLAGRVAALLARWHGGGVRTEEERVGRVGRQRLDGEARCARKRGEGDGGVYRAFGGVQLDWDGKRGGGRTHPLLVLRSSSVARELALPPRACDMETEVAMIALDLMSLKQVPSRRKADLCGDACVARLQVECAEREAHRESVAEVVEIRLELPVHAPRCGGEAQDDIEAQHVARAQCTPVELLVQFRQTKTFDPKKARH